MPEYAWITYVNPGIPAVQQLPAELEEFQRLCWERSAIVRWRCAGSADIAANLGGNLLLLLVDCSAGGADVKTACRSIRATCQSPILLTDPGGLRPEVLEEFKVVAERAAIIQPNELSDPSIILDRLVHLGITLPEPCVVLDYEHNDPVMTEIVRWVGRERLENNIQKFFPEASRVRLQPVAGGWSGAKICRLLVQGQEYFLKFFEDSDKCKREHEHHHEAVNWLQQARAEVRIRVVPDIGDDPDSQLRAFPQRKPVAYPVCYVSASSEDRHRETLKALYRIKDEAFVKKAFQRLVEVLQTGQTAGPTPIAEPPWDFSEGGNGYFLRPKIIIKTFETLEDIGDYGPSMCGNDPQRWTTRRQIIELLMSHLPTWLTSPLSVQRGHTHGDPNPRNCLLPLDGPSDLRLIDCGDYEPSGRLVSDLALIERDIKLVLMATEEEADKFFDLDTSRLSVWCKNEENSIGRGIGFKLGDALPRPTGEFPCGTRAYQLIGLVRQRAKTLCGKSDPKGIHYFAALLYWTLDSLKYEAIRPTKKLLALYSASEILLKFQHI